MAGPPTSLRPPGRRVGRGRRAARRRCGPAAGGRGHGHPGGASAEAEVEPTAAVRVRVRCGDPLDEVVLRSYCIGAAHMALGWVRTEGLAVDADGRPST